MTGPLGALGLGDAEGGVTFELAEGVVLRARRPGGPDWARARVRVAELFDPVDRLVEASQRYRMDEADRGSLANPAVWEGVSEYVTAVELAVLIVTAVDRQDGEDLRTAPPSPELFASLFRRDENLMIFMRRCRELDREIAAPKKGLAPSHATSGAAGARTAADAGN